MEKLLVSEGPQRIYSLTFAEDDEAIGELNAFAAKENLRDSTIAGIGALKQVDLARYNHETKQLESIPVEDDQVEVLSLIGQITPRDGVPNVHIHVVLGRCDGTTRGGHLVRAVVRPMLLLTITESSSPLPPHQGQ